MVSPAVVLTRFATIEHPHITNVRDMAFGAPHRRIRRTTFGTWFSPKELGLSETGYPRGLDRTPVVEAKVHFDGRGCWHERELGKERDKFSGLETKSYGFCSTIHGVVVSSSL